MKNNSCLVSVYIPTHNRAEMLMRAVYSVLAQSYKNIEVVICDDGSSDGTYELLLRNFGNDNRVVILRNEIPKGANFSRNKAIMAASGKFVTGLDDDDFFLPTRIENFVNLYSDSFSFYFSRLLNVSNMGVRENESYKGKLSLNRLLSKNLVGNQIFVARERIINAGLFDESLSAWQDYDCWVRLQAMYGSSFGLGVANYVMDTSHESPRITASEKVNFAIDAFLSKHSRIMTAINIRSQLSEKFLISGKEVSFKDIFKYASHYDLKRYIYRLIKR